MAYTAQSDFLLYNEPTMMIMMIAILCLPQEINRYHHYHRQKNHKEEYFNGKSGHTR